MIFQDITNLVWAKNAESAADIYTYFLKKLRALSLEELKQLKEELKNHFDSLRSLKEITYEDWMEKHFKGVSLKMALVDIYFPVFEGVKQGEYWFSSNRTRYFRIPQRTNQRTIYYYADAECTELKGTIELNGKEDWVVTDCDVTITQPDRVWEISFASEKDAGRFQEICKRE
jgi:arginyl-tRNA synthetase